MPHKRYILFCDESDSRGTFYSNFYGGALIEASKQAAIEAELQEVKDEVNIFAGEMKWSKIGPRYRDKYIAFVNAFFDIVERGDVKLRVMFTHNQHVPNLDEYRVGNDYFPLYYQFIKHAFGLRYCVPKGGTASASVLLDDLPSDLKSIAEFKGYLSSLSNFPIWSRAGFSIAYEDITDVDSRKHNIMQGLDIVLGSMSSRLNEKHTRPHPPAKRRTKRARAKSDVYDIIKTRVKRLHPNFNFGVSTSTKGVPRVKFDGAYRHWLFVPSNATHDPSRTKRARGLR